jgi:ubiquinone/menaquinone biosynthesis C-methylase UbiE
MSKASLSYDEVIQGNIDLHRIEAYYYDVIHSNLFNRAEQKRLFHRLSIVRKQVKGNVALDFACGTGNVAEKLLKLGFNVTAVDISPDMIEVLKIKLISYLKKGKLRVIVQNIDKQPLPCQFDLITVNSALHHLPDYQATLKRLLSCLKPKGLLYIDNEPVKIAKPNLPTKLLMVLNAYLYNFAMQFYHNKLPKRDYTHADVHEFVDSALIIQTLQRAGCKIVVDFFRSKWEWIDTPVSWILNHVKQPDIVSIIAKKR